MLRLRSQVRSVVAVALLGVMCLGSACHIWHHLTDTDCGVGTHGAQPCATCASLHGGAIASDISPSGRPHSILIAMLAPVDAAHVALPVMAGGAPRAPPSA